METLMTDLRKPMGEKLLDVEAMNNSNYYDLPYFDYIEEWSFLVYMEKIKNGYDFLGE